MTTMLEKLYGISVDPAIMEIIYGSEKAFAESIDSGDTVLFDNDRPVEILPSSALTLMEAVENAV